MSDNFQEEIWSIANLLRGDYKSYKYQDVILPFTVLRRLDAILEPTKEEVLKRREKLEKRGLGKDEKQLSRASGYSFYNISKFTFKKLTNDPDNIDKNLRSYINGFSKNVKDILDNFDFNDEIKRLKKNGLLFQIVERFYEIDLHPDKVSNHKMGTIFEEIIRRFSEQSGETAGEHFTPREVIKLMVHLLIAGNGRLRQKNVIKKIYDPACGTGGMLTIAKDEILENINDTAQIWLYGQELNPKTYAIAKSDILIKGEEAENIKAGNSFTDDKLPAEDFHYMLSNPPFGVSWKKYSRVIKDEHKKKGYDGRFGPGTPRVSDGSLLFLLHMISKMKDPEEGGSRIAIVFNGSPLFTGDAGSGESEIRRYLIENDMVEAIVGLPDQLFYNTGIHTYIWVVTNVKPKERQHKIQLIDAREMYENMRKSLGNKRKKLSVENIKTIVNLYDKFKKTDESKIFKNDYFGYRKIRIERPERDDNDNIVKKKNGEPKADSDLRDYERVPLNKDVKEYFEEEVKPHVPDAWISDSKTYVDDKDGQLGRVGYEINFTRYFYEYKPPRDPQEIEKDIQSTEKEINKLMGELF